MLEQQQRVADRTGAARLDELFLKIDRGFVLDARAADVSARRAVRRPDAHRLQPRLVEALQPILQRLQEPARVGAVDQPMVVAERQVAHRPNAIMSSTTTTRLSMLPTPRIATCGWLMIGRPNTAPKIPGLVIVNVPPCTSSGLSCFDLARAREVLNRAAQPEHVALVGVANHRDDQP
jgi:hypothetical protein